jgi:endoplasmic reticulum chaperone BiP
MKDAAAIAGLNILRIINEPTAAAVAYKIPERDDNRETKFLVFDVGGGTLVASILAQEDGVLEVLSDASDQHLGGEDFSTRLLEHLVSKFEAKHPGVVHKGDVRKNAKAMGTLRKEVEIAKRALSTETSTRVEIKGFRGGKDLKEVVTRAEFEEMNADLFERMKKPIKHAIQHAMLKKEDIDEVLVFLLIVSPSVSLTLFCFTRSF